METRIINLFGESQSELQNQINLITKFFPDNRDIQNKKLDLIVKYLDLQKAYLEQTDKMLLAQNIENDFCASHLKIVK